jgi:dienelactone hydrolase
MNHRRTFTLLVGLLALIVLSGCIGVEVVVESTPPSEDTALAPPTETLAEATAIPAPDLTAELPPAVFYDLGEATLIQDNFPADSRFRNMPAQLNGVMAVPVGDGPFPVVVMLHGTHPGCPEDETGVDRWPCDPEVEQRNYAGFEYLVRELAARGYVALAPNINAENTFGFGEPIPGVRLWQLLDQQLIALATAARGGDNAFGVELDGVADLSRLALMGHSRGGEMANYLTRKYGLDIPSGAGTAHGYGPVAGLLLVAPPRIVQDSVGSNVPLAVILPACDGDVIGQDGQDFYEAVRFQIEHSWATTVLLDGANHNGFNTILGGDMITHTGRPGCSPLLATAEQQRFLVEYAADFLIDPVW